MATHFADNTLMQPAPTATTAARPASPRMLAAAGSRILWSIDEAACLLGIAAGTLRNWISMRRIEYVKIGRLTNISQVAIDRYIAGQTVPAVELQ